MPERATILLADDDADDVMLTRLGCKRAGLVNRLIVVPDGAEAIDYFKGTGDYGDREKFPLPELVLLDLKMPRVGGLEVLKWLRSQSQWQRLPIVVLTTSCFDGDIAEAYRSGASTFLSKPVDHHDFVAALKEIAVSWLKGVDLPTTAPFTGPPAPPSGTLPAPSAP